MKNKKGNAACTSKRHRVPALSRRGRPCKCSELRPSRLQRRERKCMCGYCRNPSNKCFVTGARRPNGEAKRRARGSLTRPEQRIRKRNNVTTRAGQQSERAGRSDPPRHFHRTSRTDLTRLIGGRARAARLRQPADQFVRVRGPRARLLRRRRAHQRRRRQADPV